VTSSVAGFEAAIWVKSMYIKIHDLKPEKKIKEVLQKSPSDR